MKMEMKSNTNQLAQGGSLVFQFEVHEGILEHCRMEELPMYIFIEKARIERIWMRW